MEAGLTENKTGAAVGVVVVGRKKEGRRGLKYEKRADGRFGDDRKEPDDRVENGKEPIKMRMSWIRKEKKHTMSFFEKMKWQQLRVVRGVES